MTQLRDPRFGEPLTDLVFTAIGHARAVRATLDTDLPLLLPHTRRPFVASIARRCDGRALFSPDLHRDLSALIGQLDDAIAAGTQTEIHCDPDTGATWEEPHRTEGVETMDRARRRLRILRDTLDTLADACDAETIRAEMWGT